jgi:hypothetical protein
MSSATLHLTGDPGLALSWSLIGGSLPWSFNLSAVGQSVSKPLFLIGTTESSVDLDDIIPKPATADFEFSVPPGFTDEDAKGFSIGVWRLFQDHLGLVEWYAPATIDFGDYGALAIGLEDLWFGTPGYADDVVTVTMTRAPVPQPMTLLLLVAGVAGFGAPWLTLRRRKD